MLRDAGYLAMGGQIVDATVVEARRPRLTTDEKTTIKAGGVPAGWSKAKRAQIDTDGRWTLKRARKRPPSASAPQAPTRTELVVPVFGYKNHLGSDRRLGFIRSFVVTDAAAHDGHQRGQLLDAGNTASGVWADTAYRSAANVALLLLARRGLVPHLQRPKPRKAMPPHIMRGNATRAWARVAVEHVFAAQKCRLGLVIRSGGRARAITKLGLANLVTNMTRLAWFATLAAPRLRRACRRWPPAPAGANRSSIDLSTRTVSSGATALSPAPEPVPRGVRMAMPPPLPNGRPWCRGRGKDL
jgi:transposase, IS5 family